MAKNNMGIADQEFISAGNIISSYAGELDDMIQAYLNAMNTICETAIQDQLIRAKLGTLGEQVNSLREPLQTAAEQAAKDCKAFVEAVDAQDQFLY